MTRRMLAAGLICAIIGVGIGAMWSPRNRTTHFADNNAASARSQKAGLKEFERLLENAGIDPEPYIEQFEEMAFVVQQPQFQACASPDGRFVVWVFGEELASDLVFPGAFDQQLVRRYEFHTGDRTYLIEIERNKQDTEVVGVLFTVTEADWKLMYADNDGDGRWDVLSESNAQGHTNYYREGHSWKPCKDAKPE